MSWKIASKSPNSNSDVSAHIHDAMEDFQRMNVKNMKAFSDIGNTILLKLVKLFEKSSEIHVVFDRYDDEHSPKCTERSRRQGLSILKYQEASGRPIPDSWEYHRTKHN